MRRCLVTGANRGLGLEFVRQLAARGDRIIATARKPGQALALNELVAAFPNHVHVLPLDLEQPASIAELAREVALVDDGLDLLINNAGVLPAGERFGRLDPEQFERAFRTNARGPLLLAEALAPQLARGSGAVVANISTEMGSIARTHVFRTPSYALSKAALNMATRLLAAALAEHEVTVLALHPGWVRTEMGGERAPIEPVDAVARLIAVIDAATPARSGMFVDPDGQALPW